MRSKNKQFNAEMVRDIIAGRVSHFFDDALNPSNYAIGDVIWVRESVEIIETRPNPARTSIDGEVRVKYLADGAESGWLKYPNRLACRKVGQCIENGCWREAARIELEIVSLKFDQSSGEKPLKISFDRVGYF
jgi:hypothetical protein